jgi:hypothetical protein
LTADWKVIQIYCLGILLCDCEGCDYAGPPPTGPHKIKQYLSR